MRIRIFMIVLFSVILSACASNKVFDDQNNASAKGQYRLDVSYTKALPNGGVLKEVPTEVTIVKRRTTENNVAVQVGINILMLAAGGGVSVNPFSKHDLKGKRIEGLDNRYNILNPIPTKFVDALKDEVNLSIQSDVILGERVNEKKLIVSGGSSRLIYEVLTGNDEEKFRLKTELYVWSEKKGFHIRLHAPKIVVCSESSTDLLTQDQWAESDYERVKTNLDSLMRNCETKVVAQLSTLLDG